MAVLTAAAEISATTWQAATRAAAELLVKVGAVKADYADRCVATAEEAGPYFVVSKGVALAHARAEDSCLHPGVSLARLTAPVSFGHPANDPVDLVFCLAAVGEEHIEAMAALARSLGEGLAARLRVVHRDELAALLREVTTP